MAEQNPQRMCDVCGGVDDHPRHVFGHTPGQGETPAAVAEQALKNANASALTNVLAHIRDGSTSMRHMDCCREVGCPDGSCNLVTAGAETKKGDALRRHLTSQDRPTQLPALPTIQEAGADA